jgi:hypothetical protein
MDEGVGCWQRRNRRPRGHLAARQVTDRVMAPSPRVSRLRRRPRRASRCGSSCASTSVASAPRRGATRRDRWESTVRVDELRIVPCLSLAVPYEGREFTAIERPSDGHGALHPLEARVHRSPRAPMRLLRPRADPFRRRHGPRGGARYPEQRHERPPPARDSRLCETSNASG